MACVSAALSVTGLSAVAGMMSGAGLVSAVPGLSNVMSVAGGGILSSASGALGSVAGSVIPGSTGFGDIASVAAGLGITNPLGGAVSALSNLSGAAPSLAGIGSGVLGGALNGSVGSSFVSSLGSGSFLSAMGSHTGDLFGSGPLQMAQTFGAADAFSGISSSLAGSIVDAGSLNFGASISSLTQTFPLSGNFGNYLGGAFPNNLSMVTNGLSSLTGSVGSLPSLGMDLGNLGSAFNLGDIANFGNPGQVVGKLLSTGGAGITGIGDALATVGIDANMIPNLSSSDFNGAMTEALGMVTDPGQIAYAQRLLGSNVPGMTSLADFANFEQVMANSFDDIPYDNFDQFREQLQSVNLGSLSTPGQLGNLVTNLSLPDLNIISDTDFPIAPGALTELTNTYLGGSGHHGAITTGDLMGTVGGVGLGNPKTRTGNTYDYANTMDYLNSQGKLTDIKARYSELVAAVSGPDYLDTGDYSTATSIIDPYTSIPYATLDNFAEEKMVQIDSALQTLASDSSVSGALGTLQSSWTTMQKKVYDEKEFASRTDLQLELRNNSKDNAYYFGTQLEDRVKSADKTSIIEGMFDSAVVFNNDGYGEYWDAYTQERKNQQLLSDYGIKWRAEYQEEI